VKEGIWWVNFIFMYENRAVKPAEVVVRRGWGSKGE
jgi:hypothetical protein